MLIWMNLGAPVLVSEAEFLALPESLERVELLDGKVVVSRSPSLLHQDVVSEIVFALKTWAKQQAGPVFVGQSPIDIRFAAERILQPDAFVVLGGVDRNAEGPLDKIPELCIEVLSRDRLYDRVTKRMIYAASGVLEYWTVDPSGAIEQWSGEALSNRKQVDTTLYSQVLPGFELQLSALFAASAGDGSGAFTGPHL